ncbi:hypothetical protein KK083_09715 [Fulvivirgaceae bacterium PWU4]|uniref:Uncharacterized protein n=1 Tax=Chryseosolibacter histidini TaxID=2782349 RepID=A0AAP2DIX1_9BACT|nr:hypothetical protein [Chryseosolibacter histidini]MBT1697151.1 hypothetical protein [Chryseosolibacter histidini]
MKTPNLEITPQNLELRFSQLLRVTDKLKSSKYSDSKKKEKLHQTLMVAITKIDDCNFCGLSKTELWHHHVLIERIFLWLEYLVDSTINQTPYEIMNCLELVLADWIDDLDNYVLLTSLSNKRNDFAFHYDQDPSLLIEIRKLLKQYYDIDLELDVIRIILPKFLSHDYLTAVHLYHELAHFIDWKYSVTDQVLFKRGLLFRKDADENKIKYQEHFADIFAAQYVDRASCVHLSYLTYRKPNGKHPPTRIRIELVENFLDEKESMIVSDIKKATLSCTRRPLKKRFKTAGISDFNNLIPIEVRAPEELHGLFIEAWDIWQNPKSALRKNFKRSDLYRILNNLVEKSISNYFLTQAWEKKYVSDEIRN